MWKSLSIVLFLLAFLLPSCTSSAPAEHDGPPRAMAGAYYFEGWAGQSYAAFPLDSEWAFIAPTHLCPRLAEDFGEREPEWGWRDDTVEIMERQIDLAADHGLGFFAFCWYWHESGGAIDPEAIEADPLNSGLARFLAARNRDRMKFCVLVANHQGFLIEGAERWKAAGDYLASYLNDPGYLRVDGRPLVILFDALACGRAGIEALHGAARGAGLEGVSIAGCYSGEPEDGVGFRTAYSIAPGYDADAQEHSYAELADFCRGTWRGRPDQPFIPLVMAGFDKRPWEGPRGLFGLREGWYFTGRDPSIFHDLVRDAIGWMDAHPFESTSERILLVYAWNEFGEGGYLAPTKGDPTGAYLDALSRALRGP